MLSSSRKNFAALREKISRRWSRFSQQFLRNLSREERIGSKNLFVIFSFHSFKVIVFVPFVILCVLRAPKALNFRNLCASARQSLPKMLDDTERAIHQWQKHVKFTLFACCRVLQKMINLNLASHSFCFAWFSIIVF
jgi:hypothetical protein